MLNIDLEYAASYIDYPNYIFWPDSRIYSTKSNKYMKKFKNHSDRDRIALYHNHKYRKFFVSRLIYQIFNNDFNIKPTEDVEHINGNKYDNNIQNLRKVSKTVNQLNIRDKIQSNNTSGIRGVHYDKDMKKFRAVIYFNRKRKCLGFFSNKTDAEDTYLREHALIYKKMMSLMIMIIFIISTGCTHIKPKSEVKIIHASVEEMSNAYYTGCIGSIVAIHDLKYRNDLENGPVGFAKLKAHCLGQAWDYYWFLNGEVTK